MEKFGLTES